MVSRRWMYLATLVGLLGLLTFGAVRPVLADTVKDVTAALERGDVYLTPNAISHGVATRADVGRLQSAVDRAARAGVNEKIAIISSYPSKYSNAQEATVALRAKIGFDGILVIVTPKAIGISSSLLTRRDIESIDRNATNNSACSANKPVGCALLAAQGAVPAYQDEAAIIKVAGTLKGQSVVITPGAISGHLAVAADAGKLDAVVRTANAQGVTEKFLVVSKYPAGYSNPTDAAGALSNQIGLSGVLVLVAPDGIGVGSDLLSGGDRNKIAAQAGSCASSNVVPCAVLSGKAAIPLYKAQQAHQNTVNNIIAGIFGLVVLAILGLFVWLGLRKRKRTRQHLEDLRTAAGNTLAMADESIQTIEGKGTLEPAVSKAYDAALALRDRANQELDKAKTAAALTQVNQDAAQAVLSLQAVMTTLKLPLSSDNPLLDSMPHRCFYCGRTDRPPYTTKTIGDKKGNHMEVDVCDVDAKELAKGVTPKIKTVQSGRNAIPWWAVSSDPYYYRYGGGGWQYYLPYATGVNVNQWYGGASSGSYSNPPPAAAGQGWSGSGGDRDTTQDVDAGHISGSASWGGGSDKSGSDW
jgi:hypothetical protein